MTDSSSNNAATILARVHPEQMLALVSILREVSTRHVSFVERVYNERARHFHETLRVLKEIGWVEENAGKLSLAYVAPAAALHPRYAIEKVAETPGIFQAALADYLRQFRVENGKMVHQPSAQTRLEHSSVRNFFIAAGGVTYDTDVDRYILSADYAPLYLWAKNITGATSKAELLHRLKEREQLGSSAELVVLDWERKRVGPEWQAHVEHVSAINPGACFDIQSVSLEPTLATPRFVEVKAVPADSCQFFWTAAELEAALLLREKYFLYLIPVIGGEQFDCSKMLMIQDPYESVYRSPESWTKTENVIICRRK
jgi:hypothetical protein